MGYEEHPPEFMDGFGFWRNHIGQQVDSVDQILTGPTSLETSGPSPVPGVAAAADIARGVETISSPKADSGSGMDPADGIQDRSQIQSLLAAKIPSLHQERLSMTSHHAVRLHHRHAYRLRKDATTRGVSIAKIKSRMGLRSHCFRTGQYVLTPDWRQCILNSAGFEFVPTCEPWDESTRLQLHKGDDKGKKRGLYIPWGNETLFLHPLVNDMQMAIERVYWEGSRGVAVVPVRRKEPWFWALGEIAVDWWDLPRGESIWVDRWGVQHTQEHNIHTRVVLFDALGRHQEGMNATDWMSPQVQQKKSPKIIVGRPKRPLGQPRKVWKATVTQLARDGQLPLPDCDDMLETAFFSGPVPLPSSPTPHSDVSGITVHSPSPRSDVSGIPVHSPSHMHVDVTPSDCFPSPTLDKHCLFDDYTGLSILADECLQDDARPPNTVATIDQTPVYDSAVVSPSLPSSTVACKGSHMPSSRRISAWIDSVTQSTKLKRSQMSEGPPSQLFHSRDRSVQSFIETDGEIRECQKWREWLLQEFSSSVFRRDGNTYAEIEANASKRGPHGWCKLELLPNSEPRACKAIRVVGIREQVLKEKCQEFLDKGWIRESHSNWVARGFLVPKPGVNKWRLVIDYRYLNSCLKGHEFPLPVIEDTLLSQAGNHLWTLLDLEDGFHQMPLEESSRFLTAFCTPFGVFEWNVLPMGVKVGPAAFQRMVSWCLAHHQVPGARAYIDDILTGTRPTERGKGKLLDSRAFEEHYHQVRALLLALAECHLQVKPEKCHMFMGRVKYCGHILEGGMRKPAPSKVAAIKERSEAMISTPKQMKGFLGVCNWYSIYIKNHAALAAPLMDSLHGKYSHVAGKEGSKGKCVVKREDNHITWTPLMRENFSKLEDAICEKTALYIPSADGEYAIHVDASDFGVGAVLEQQDEHGQWVPCAFFSRKLEKGQRVWGVREKETYALVSCLLKFKSWIRGRKVTIVSDHKSLESWYKEDLCTMAGPLGRWGRWHEFLSRYNIVVVYKPGEDNVVADGLSRWAYPAGEADDTNFHGSDADFEGVSRWEAREKAWELEQLSDVVPASPEMSVQAVRLQFAADKRRLQGAQAASSVFCALYVAAWLQQNHGVLLSTISSPSPGVLFPSSSVCVLQPLPTLTLYLSVQLMKVPWVLLLRWLRRYRSLSVHMWTAV